MAFARRLFVDLAALRGDTGGRRLLVGRPDVVRLETDDPGAIFDVDRLEDLDWG